MTFSISSELKALCKIRQDTNSIALCLFQDMDFLYLPHWTSHLD